MTENNSGRRSLAESAAQTVMRSEQVAKGLIIQILKTSDSRDGTTYVASLSSCIKEILISALSKVGKDFLWLLPWPLLHQEPELKLKENFL